MLVKLPFQCIFDDEGNGIDGRVTPDHNVLIWIAYNNQPLSIAIYDQLEKSYKTYGLPVITMKKGTILYRRNGYKYWPFITVQDHQFILIHNLMMLDEYDDMKGEGYVYINDNSHDLGLAMIAEFWSNDWNLYKDQFDTYNNIMNIYSL